jgi:hypothetical protein
MFATVLIPSYRTKFLHFSGEVFLGEELHFAGAAAGLRFTVFGGRHRSDRITLLSDLGKWALRKYAKNRPALARHFYRNV